MKQTLCIFSRQKWTFVSTLTKSPTNVGLLLPCNVIVYEEGNTTVVNIIDPKSMTNFIQDPALEAVAKETRLRLKRVSDAIQK